VARFADYAALGLEERDIIVYETLYSQAGSSVRAIAQNAGLNRGTVYETIKRLTDVGLISFTQVKQRRHYTAAEPEVFLSLIRERRDQLQQLETTAVQYAQTLQSQKEASTSGYYARFYENDDGIASILRDVLQTVQGLRPAAYCVISSQRVSSFIYDNFRSFSRQRIKLGIQVRVVADAHSSEKLVLAQRRQLASVIKPLSSYIIIYGDKTALISLSSTNQLSGVVIKDKGTAAMQQLIFEQLWQNARTTL